MSNISKPKSNNEFYLKALTGKLKGTVFKLSSKEIFVGRDPSNHISIQNDSSLSRRHARFIFNEGQYYIQNVSSTNFIKINNEKSTQSILKNNYIVTIGEQTFKFISASVDLKINSEDHLAHKKAQPSIKKNEFLRNSKNNKNILYAFVGFLFFAGFYIVTADPHKKARTAIREIATTEKIFERVEKSQQENTAILDDIEKSGKNTTNYKNAHSFYIKGFRDFQKGLYAQALSSFETCLSIHPSHALAKRYSELSRNRQEEMISFHMNQGNTNLENGKYDFCISSYKNVMSQINDKTDVRYIESKTNHERCLNLERSKY